MHKKKCVVFGGSGFIGSHLLKVLSDKNEIDLVSVDLREPKQKIDNVTYIKCDVCDLDKLIIDGPVDTIFNLAAVHTTPGHETYEYYLTNVQGATEVTSFARRHDVKALVFTSSISVYGPGEDAKTEETPPSPESSYGWSKWLAENIHKSWLTEDESRKLVICRPAVIFGSGEGGNFTRMAKLLKKGFFIYPGRKDTVKACYYVDDLIGALLFALRKTDSFTIFNGCYPDGYTLEEIVDTFRQSHFPKARVFMVPKPLIISVAYLLKPFSIFDLGIHPDRIMKLVTSTNIVPTWLSKNDAAPRGALGAGIDKWANESNGRFD